MLILLTDWCHKHGIKTMDAKNWYKRGKLPAKVYSVPIERLMIEESAPVPERMRVGNPNFGKTLKST
jgi:predicted site-specific integrase-resolvase